MDKNDGRFDVGYACTFVYYDKRKIKEYRPEPCTGFGAVGYKRIFTIGGRDILLAYSPYTF